MKLYPVKFTPIFKEKIWGGKRISSFSNALSSEKKIGELWQLVDRQDDQSQIANGPYEGKTLHDLVDKFPEDFLGTRIMPDEFGRFPLISKFLHAQENVSIQVHPAEERAHHKEEDEGKIEAWYILDAGPDAQIIRGVLPHVTPDEFLQAIKEDRPLECLNTVPARKGDIVLIPPGMVHSIGGDVLLYEVSQNSDVTYRLYDWDRLTEEGTTRKLHLEKGLDVVDFEAMGRTRARSSSKDGAGDERKILVRCPKFILEKIDFSRQIEEEKTDERFELIVPVEGTGSVQSRHPEGNKFHYNPGECFVLPGGMKNYLLDPDQDTELLKVTPTS